MQPNSLNQVPSAWTKTTSYRIDIFSPKKSPSNSTCCIWRCQGIDLSILGLLNRLFESWTWREERCLFGESWNFTTRDPEDWRCWNFSTHGMCCLKNFEKKLNNGEIYNVVTSLLKWWTLDFGLTKICMDRNSMKFFCLCFKRPFWSCSCWNLEIFFLKFWGVLGQKTMVDL